jgi:hypothetical protein
MKRLLLHLALVLLWPALAAAQQPFYTDDADVTPRGKFHFDFFDEYDWLKPVQAPHQQQNTFNIKVNYGLTDHLELDLDSPLLTIVNDPTAVPRRPAGFGDTNMGFKYRFMPDREGSTTPEVAVATYVEVPTGNRVTGLGSGVTDLWIYGVLQKWLVRDRIVLSINGGYLFYGNTSTGVVGIRTARGHVATMGASVIKKYTGKLSLGAELTAAATTNLDLQRGQLQALTGGNYDMGHGLTFDFGVLGGWYAATPTFGVQLGLSVDVK